MKIEESMHNLYCNTNRSRLFSLKGIFLLLIAFMILQPFSSRLQAQTVTVWADSVAGVIGQPEWVPVYVSGFHGIDSLSGSVQWDTSVVKYLSFSNTSAPAIGNMTVNTSNTVAGELSFTWKTQTVGGDSLTDSTTLFSLIFDVVGPQGSQSPVAFTNSPVPWYFSRWFGNPVPNTRIDGKVTIPACTMAPVATWSWAQVPQNPFPGIAIDFTDLSPNVPVNWLWDFGDGSHGTTPNPRHYYSFPGTYQVCLHVHNNCGSDTSCQPVIPTSPPPVAAFNWVDQGANTAAFTNQSTPTPLNYTWYFGDGNSSTQQDPVHQYAAPGTYIVCMVAQGFSGTDTSCQAVTVTCGTTTASFNVQQAGMTHNFTDQTFGGVNHWAWDFGDGNVDSVQSPSHMYAGPGTYTACLIASSPCDTDTICVPVTVTCSAGPIAAFSAGVFGSSVSLQNQSIGTCINTAIWDFGDGNFQFVNCTPCCSPTPPVLGHTYMASGTYTVCLFVVDSCGIDSTCQNVTVSCPFSSTFSMSNTGLAVNFSYTGTPATTWAWDFGDGNTSTLQNPSHTYAANGNYNVCLLAGNGTCQDTICQVFSWPCAAPTAGFSSVANGLQVAFTDTSQGTATGWSWNFGGVGTSTQQHPTYSFASAGTYNVCLTTTSSCGSNTVCNNVTVVCAPPGTNFGHFSTGLDAWFADQTTGNVTSWAWTFGDGGMSSAQNPQHTYNSPGTYNVCLITTNSCGPDTLCKNVTITCPNVVASYGSASNGLFFTFTGYVQGGPATSWHWDFGDGSTDTLQQVTHAYALQGSYTVELIVTTACGSDTITGTATTWCQTPTAFFTHTAFNSTVNFLGQVTGSQIPQHQTTYQWDFGDGTGDTVLNPVHVYAQSGTYTVCLSTANYCANGNYCTTVTVNCSQPSPLSLGPDTLIAPGDSVLLDAGGGYLSYDWRIAGIFGSVGMSQTYQADSAAHCVAVVSDASGCGWSDTIEVVVDTNCVWPGDANSDLIADNNDVLAIGLTYNFTGPVRHSADTSWTCQPAWPWPGTFLNGVNHKHADCDGNGLVDSLDMILVNQHYGSTHMKGTGGATTQTGNPPLYFDSLKTSVMTSDTVILQVALGTDTATADSIYGIAFSLTYDNTLVDTNSVWVEYDSSWLGTKGTDMITLDKDFWHLGRTDVALCRIDHNHRSGKGEICRIGIIMLDDIAGKTHATDTLNLGFASVQVIMTDGTIVPISAIPGAVEVIELEDNVAPPVGAADIRLFPNPAGDWAAVESPTLAIQDLKLFDLNGKLLDVQVTDVDAHRKRLDTHALAAGFYFLRIRVAGHTVMRRLAIGR